MSENLKELLADKELGYREPVKDDFAYVNVIMNNLKKCEWADCEYIAYGKCDVRRCCLGV